MRGESPQSGAVGQQDREVIQPERTAARGGDAGPGLERHQGPVIARRAERCLSGVHDERSKAEDLLVEVT